MKWILVLIVLDFNGYMEANVEGTFDDMNDCFWARDYLATEREGEDGFFPLGEQGVCISSDKFHIELKAPKVPKLKPGVDSDSIRG